MSTVGAIILLVLAIPLVSLLFFFDGKRTGIKAAIQVLYKNGAHGQARKVRKELLERKRT